jgi:hypothetical protein
MKSGILFFLILILHFSVSAFAYDWSTNQGDGSEGNPYQISEPNHLMSIGSNADLLDRHFILTNDIIFDPNNNPNHVFDKALIAPDTSTSSNYQGTVFSGTFDGEGYSIFNLKINSSGADYIGLFGNIDSGTVNNLTLRNVDIQADGYVGGLAGSNSGEITNCITAGNISGNNYIGGSCGQNTGTLVSCSYQGGTVSGDRVGGLIGWNFGTIKYSYALGTIQGGDYVGGLTGIAWGLVEQCFANCNVTGDSYVGGLSGDAGETSLVLLNCYSQGQVEGNDMTGGLVGVIHGATPVAVNCYSATQVIPPVGCEGDPQCRVGGFVGLCFSEPIGCYWDTEASGLTDGVANQDPDPSGVVGLPTEQMMLMDTFVGWGCGGAWTIQNGVDYPHLAWEGVPGDPFPREQYSGGSGVSSDPYLISTPQELSTINNYYCHLSESFKLIADIDMNELAEGEFKPIGSTQPFTGIFDGNGHIISNLTCINSENNRGRIVVGLFGTVGGGYESDVTTKIYNLTLIDPNIVQSGTDTYCTSGALAGISDYGSQISNIAVINTNVSNSTTDASGGGIIGRNYGVLSNLICSGRIETTVYAGGIVGANHGTLKHCEFSGQVAGGNCTGGLAGRNTQIVDQCSTRGTVEGQHNTGLVNSGIGGLVGECYYGSKIRDSYSQCDVTGDHDVGGFCGSVLNSELSNSYSTGSVNGSSMLGGFIGRYISGTFLSCYFLNTAGPDNGYGTPLDDPNMMTQSNFTDWDFLGESTNGENDIWRMCTDEVDYPRLSQEYAQNGDFACGDGVDILRTETLPVEMEWISLTYRH